MRTVLRVAGYRFRATFRRRWGDYLTIVLLIATVGGLAMTAVAAARRTQSSFPAFVAGTNPSDLNVIDTAGAAGGGSSSFVTELAALPHVKRVASWGTPNFIPLRSDGSRVTANTNPDASGVFVAVSPNGLFTTQDRVTLVRGRMANPKRADEVVMSAEAARIIRITLGGVRVLGFYTDAQTRLPAYGTTSVPPVFRVDIKLVGIVAFNNEVVQDDIDHLPTFVVLNPAIAHRLIQCCSAGGSFVGLQLDHGARDVAAVETEITHALPGASVTSISSVQVAKAERAIEPESIALGVFGGISALAALLVTGQVIGRQFRAGADDRSRLRGLGAGPVAAAVDGLVGTVGAVVVGALLAAAVAVALSPLAPLGPVRAVDRSRGVSFDWTVIGLGLLVLIGGLSAIAGVLAYHGAPHRVARRQKRSAREGTIMTRAVSSSGLSPSAATGIRFAVEPGSGTNAAPVRSAILGGVLAIVVVAATVIFGTSLNTLVARPALYGWNWDYELRSAYSGVSNIPEKKATPLLDHDKDVAAWTGVYFATLRIDGVTVPVLGATPNASVAPSLLSGRMLAASNEIVLGATTLTQLHKRLGDTVAVGSGANPKQLVIVGTAALPAVGIATDLHMELATGAVVSEKLIPANDRGFGAHDGPEAFFVRLRSGVDRSAALRRLQHVADGMYTDSNHDGPVAVLPVQRPAEIVNYRTMGATPALLGTGLAAGAVGALWLTLIASVRRRQRDLALLKTLGFTRRQLAAVVAWQASVAAAIGAAVGIPIGIIVGRSFWTRFAGAIHVVPRPSVPVASIILVVIGALVLANVVAALPGRRAARTPAALLLHDE